MAFDGVDDRVEVFDNTSLHTPRGAVTVSAWVWPATVSRAQSVVSKPATDAGPRHSWQIFLTSGGAQAGRLGTTQDDYGLQGTETLTPDTWHHVALTFDGATVQLYRDGQRNVSTDASGEVLYAADSVLLGAEREDELMAQLDGRIDEARVAPWAASAERLATEFRNQMNPSDFVSWGAFEPP